jgi:uncharacterized membrane protein (DUF373 family)
VRPAPALTPALTLALTLATPAAWTRRRHGTGARMLPLVKKLEHWITLVLIGMLAVVVLLATVELGITIARDIVAPPVLFPGIDKLLDIFGKMLLVLIGIELIETMRSFAGDGIVRVSVVLTVAMIALCRKIIVLEVDHVQSSALFGIATLMVGLSVAHFAFVRGRA